MLDITKKAMACYNLPINSESPFHSPAAPAFCALTSNVYMPEA